jgi:superfamily II DNA helicase RecQ
MHIVRGTTPMFVCLPTGAGKTLLMQLPALLDKAKTTIVIVPLVALAEDLLIRCRKINLDAILWNKSRSRQARVVIVVAETATMKEFGSYALTLYLRGELDRIFIDEAHKLITDLGYRPKLYELRR